MHVEHEFACQRTLEEREVEAVAEYERVLHEPPSSSGSASCEPTRSPSFKQPPAELREPVVPRCVQSPQNPSS